MTTESRVGKRANHTCSSGWETLLEVVVKVLNGCWVAMFAMMCLFRSCDHNFHYTIPVHLLEQLDLETCFCDLEDSPFPLMQKASLIQNWSDSSLLHSNVLSGEEGESMPHLTILERKITCLYLFRFIHFNVIFLVNFASLRLFFIQNCWIFTFPVQILRTDVR